MEQKMQDQMEGAEMATKEEILDDQHWTHDSYRQRITTKRWRKLLLNDDDTIIYRGRVTRFKHKTIFPGVVEIWKEM